MSTLPKWMIINYLKRENKKAIDKKNKELKQLKY